MNKHCAGIHQVGNQYRVLFVFPAKTEKDLVVQQLINRGGKLKKIAFSEEKNCFLLWKKHF